MTVLSHTAVQLNMAPAVSSDQRIGGGCEYAHITYVYGLLASTLLTAHEMLFRLFLFMRLRCYGAHLAAPRVMRLSKRLLLDKVRSTTRTAESWPVHVHSHDACARLPLGCTERTSATRARVDDNLRLLHNDMGPGVRAHRRLGSTRRYRVHRSGVSGHARTVPMYRFHQPRVSIACAPKSG